MSIKGFKRDLFKKCTGGLHIIYAMGPSLYKIRILKYKKNYLLFIISALSFLS